MKCDRGWFAEMLASGDINEGDIKLKTLLRGLNYPTIAAARTARANAIVNAKSEGLSCNYDLLGNGMCDNDCNSIAFNFDDGDCDPSDGCYKYLDCASCTLNMNENCGWCGSETEGACLRIPTGINTEESVCDQTWFQSQCTIKEPSIQLLEPRPGAILEAENSYPITHDKKGYKNI